MPRREIDARVRAAEREFGLRVEFQTLAHQALRRAKLDDVRTIARAVGPPVVGMGQARARHRGPIVVFGGQTRGAAARADVEILFLPRAARQSARARERKSKRLNSSP